MGAWETGNFGNDDAMDFAMDVTEGNKKEILNAINTIAASPEDDYLESPDCCIALAAIEYVAAAKNNAPGDFPEEAEEWIKKNKLLPFTEGGLLGIGAKEIDIVALSKRAIDKIKTHSELQELWKESGEYEEWLSVLEDLKKRIS